VYETLQSFLRIISRTTTAITKFYSEPEHAIFAALLLRLQKYYASRCSHQQGGASSHPLGIHFIKTSTRDAPLPTRLWRHSNSGSGCVPAFRFSSPSCCDKRLSSCDGMAISFHSHSLVALRGCSITVLCTMLHGCVAVGGCKCGPAKTEFCCNLLIERALLRHTAHRMPLPSTEAEWVPWRHPMVG
jgi:hypothetical protein